jgi:hypothetical protein
VDQALGSGDYKILSAEKGFRFEAMNPFAAGVLLSMMTRSAASLVKRREEMT